MLILVLISKLVIAGFLLGSSLTLKGRSFLVAHRKSLLWATILIITVVLIYISSLQYQFWNSNEATKTLITNSTFGTELQKYGVDFISNYLEPIFRAINSFIKLIIPSYIGGTYLLFFLLTRLWGEYIISFIFALLFLWVMIWLNKKYDNRFFYDEEPYFGAIAIFLTGWPGCLYYLIILLTSFLIFNASETITVKKRAELIKTDKLFKEERQTNQERATAPTVEEKPTPEESDESARFTLYYFWLPIAIVIIIIMAYSQQSLPYFNLLKI